MKNWLALFFPTVRFTDRNHGAQNRVPGLLLQHHFIREHTTVPANVSEIFGQLPYRPASNSRRPERYSICPLGSSGRQWRPVLSWVPRPFTVRIVLRHMKIDRPGTQAPASWFSSRPATCRRRSNQIVGVNGIFRCVISQRVEQACAPCPPGNRAPSGRSTTSNNFNHSLPTVHATPANLAFGGQPFAMILSNLQHSRNVAAIFFEPSGIAQPTLRRRSRNQCGRSRTA